MIDCKQHEAFMSRRSMPGYGCTVGHGGKHEFAIKKTSSGLRADQAGDYEIQVVTCRHCGKDEVYKKYLDD